MDDKHENEVPLNSAELFSGDLAKVIFENASNEAEIDNLRSKIQSMKSEIAELKGKIGEYCWQAFVTSGRSEPAIKGLLDDIRSRADEITVLEQDIQTFQDCADQPIQPPIQLLMERQTSCTSCGTLNDASAKFCSSCGMALEEAPIDRKPQYRVEDYGICPLCGANLQDDAIFCYTCGARVKI